MIVKYYSMIHKLRHPKTNLGQVLGSLIRLYLPRSYAKYLFSGAGLTALGFGMFILLSLVLGQITSSIITEISLHSLRFLLLRNFVFERTGNKTTKHGLKRGIMYYIGANSMMSIFSISVVALLSKFMPPAATGIVIIALSASLGYYINRYIFRDAALRSKWKKPTSH